MTFGLAGVAVDYHGHGALVDVTVPVHGGRITVVVGADGAGKTTTARCLVGLAIPVRGEVRVPPPASIGYQPEAGGTWADLTVSENLEFVADAHGGSLGGRIEELIDLTGLATARDRLAGALSGGMRQKLAVSMAMVARPDLLVLDEPTTGLDPVSRAELWRLLARAAADGAAVAVTSTYLDEAERGSCVVVLDEGAVIASGTAASIRSAFSGTLTVSPQRPEGTRLAWRRGSRWHRWWPDGDPPDDATVIPPDLEDVVTATAVGRTEAT